MSHTSSPLLKSKFIQKLKYKLQVMCLLLNNTVLIMCSMQMRCDSFPRDDDCACSPVLAYFQFLFID